MIHPDARSGSHPESHPDAGRDSGSDPRAASVPFECEHPTALIGQLQTSQLAAAALLAEEEDRRAAACGPGLVPRVSPRNARGDSAQHWKRPAFEQTLITRLPPAPRRRPRRPSQSVVVRVVGALLLVMALAATVLILLL